MHRTLLVSLTALTLAACASSAGPVYGPSSAYSNGVGYSDYRIENDRWRIRYTGARGQDEDDIERLALRRAGELAITNGYDWFTVVHRQVDTEGDENERPVRVGGSIGQTFGTGGFRGSSVGVGIAINPGAGKTETVLSLEIIAGRGEPRPEGAYDAARMANPAGAYAPNAL
ncbi:CC0125/CC1285 family lipoprotein [Oceanicaulis sp.]|uniref:CC0125/CC1285 family lipoprotein n=1 Tax=Oceanicaulis sp. TaxID=1924941 RepID=UPI003BAD9D5F